MGKICALTGHRELVQGFCVNRLYDTLEEKILKGYTFFRCGMARGFDLKALECLVDLRQKHVFTVEACIPYAGHVRSFPPAERERYKMLLSWCEERTVLFASYVNGCFLARDRYMVDGADLLLAYCIRQQGGAAYTVQYAKKQGVPVEIFC